jgi:hypothetical protein
MRFSTSVLAHCGYVGAVVLAIAAASVAGCRSADDEAPPIATPAFTANRERVPLGGPVEITYRFTVAQTPPQLQENLRVMVHFLDSDEEQLWTDDHDPPVPTSQWTPGQTIEYSRTVFIPIFPYVGPAAVHMGLYSPTDGRRYPLDGDTIGQRSYRVGMLELVPRPEDAFIIYKDGWHNAEVARDNAAVEWQWTRREATLSFRNPRREAVLYLHLDGRPDLLPEPLEVLVRIGDTELDRFTLTDREEHVRKVQIAPEQFGDGESVDVTLQVNQTFVPSLLPQAQSTDTRELGIRVFHAYIEPK